VPSCRGVVELNSEVEWGTTHAPLSEPRRDFFGEMSRTGCLLATEGPAGWRTPRVRDLQLSRAWARPDVLARRLRMHIRLQRAGRGGEVCRVLTNADTSRANERIPLNRPAGTFSPTGGEGWDEG
jgi:hypothetical protein